MAATISLHKGMEPQSIKEVYHRADQLQWEEVMKEEIQKLEKQDTWKAVRRPEGANIVGSKWVFHLKKDANGAITSHRARLVVQEFSQIPGVDFDETFTLITQMMLIRTVLALAARHDWEICQVDIKSAYLYGELEEHKVIYMKPPPSKIQVCGDNEVLQLRKAIYGLKQSGRHWYQTLRGILRKINFTRSEHNHRVFL